MNKVSIRARPRVGRSAGSSSEEFGICFVYPDEFHQVFDAEVGERHDAIIFDAKDPDETVLGIHSVGVV